MSLILRLLFVSVCVTALVSGQDQGSFLHDPKNVHNAEHIKQHMGEVFDGYDDDEQDQKLKLDDNEAMEFHYFKLHDYDNNNKLDGQELGVAMTHFNQEHAEGEEGESPSSYSMSDEELGKLIELILQEDDLNDDGYVDYYEFVQASRRGNEEPPSSNDNL